MSDLFQLKPGEISWQPVLSGSMAPRFLPNDEVEIRIIDIEEDQRSIKPGKIAVFYKDGSFFFHRIIFSIGKKVFEKGDANTQGSWILRKRIIGLVVGHRRMEDGKYVSISLTPFNRRKAYGLFIIQMAKKNVFTRLIWKMARRTKQCISTILK